MLSRWALNCTLKGVAQQVDNVVDHLQDTSKCQHMRETLHKNRDAVHWPYPPCPYLHDLDPSIGFQNGAHMVSPSTRLQDMFKKESASPGFSTIWPEISYFSWALLKDKITNMNQNCTRTVGALQHASIWFMFNHSKF